MEKSWLYKGRRAYRMKNYVAAKECYEQAIAEGDAEAMYLAALMYQSGTGVPKSICKAKVLFKQAAEAGHKKAANALAMLVNTSYIQRCAYVYEVCRLRENGKYKEAMEEFLFIVNGAPKIDDYAAECMYWIGMMYKLGQGVPKDEHIANEWLRKAADNSSSKAVNELNLNKGRPEVVCEDDWAKATVYVSDKIRRADRCDILTSLAGSYKSDIYIYVRGECIDLDDMMIFFEEPDIWNQGTKLDICAVGEDAEEAANSLVDLFYSNYSNEYLEKLILQGRIERKIIKEKEKFYETTVIEFDEVKYVNQCMQNFLAIRKSYHLDEDVLSQAKQHPLLESLAIIVLEGCTEQGLKEVEKKLPEWLEKNKRDNNYYWPDGEVCYEFPLHFVIDVTADRVDNMERYYSSKCFRLSVLMKEVYDFEETIKVKEKLAATGDVEAMFFLGKAYETGRLCVQDKQKVQAYVQMAKDRWAGELAEKYKAWLDKAVQDSGLEMLGELGREYIDGTFAEAAKKNNSTKLKKELKWLNKAIEAGDGWAAFTKGNICYYGYGRWGEKKKEAYINYQKAAKSKESIYALEYGELCFRNGDLKADVANAFVKAFNE